MLASTTPLDLKAATWNGIFEFQFAATQRFMSHKQLYLAHNTFASCLWSMLEYYVSANL